MERKNALRATLSVGVIIIGVYMAVSYWGSALPPTLSGVAFVLLGTAEILG